MFEDLIDGTKKVSKMTKEEKEIVRLTRDRNIFEKELEHIKKLNNQLTEEINYLKRRNKILETIETNFRMRIDKYKDKMDKPAAYEDFKKILEEIDLEEKRIEDEKKNISYQI